MLNDDRGPRHDHLGEFISRLLQPGNHQPRIKKVVDIPPLWEKSPQKISYNLIISSYISFLITSCAYYLHVCWDSAADPRQTGFKLSHRSCPFPLEYAQFASMLTDIVWLLSGFGPSLLVSVGCASTSWLLINIPSIASSWCGTVPRIWIQHDSTIVLMLCIVMSIHVLHLVDVITILGWQFQQTGLGGSLLLIWWCFTSYGYV